MDRFTSIEQAEVSNLLKQLKTSSEVLNVSTRSLTDEVSFIEDTINELNIGVTTEVLCDKSVSEDGLLNTELKLRYGKETGHWGFVVSEHIEDQHFYSPDDRISNRSWTFRDAPRELRLRAVVKIPDLLKAMLRETNQLAERVSSSASFASDLAATMKSIGSAEGQR
ncbi:MAG TPA: hypothetical protein VLK33_18875 [Terriglobales bacterium]|nr:hypothetical protein [Terriglobales bacterium]